MKIEEHQNKLKLASLLAWQRIVLMSGVPNTNGNRNSHSCHLHNASSKTADMPCRCTRHTTTDTSSDNSDGARNGLCGRALMVSRYMGWDMQVMCAVIISWTCVQS